MPVYLNGLAAVVPEQPLPQELVLEFARRILGPRYEQFEQLAGTFGTSGIETRYTVATPQWFEEPKSWPERNRQYLEGAKKLFVNAARDAMDNAGWKAEEIDTVVTVSSTGIATPTLEALTWKEMGFRNDIRRIPVFGLGCAGGVTGMSIAQAQAQARPGSKVLMVTVEICTLSFRTDRDQKADIIATVLFGDGAAAACLCTDRGNSALPVVEIEEGQEQIWPDTLNIMGWDVDETGFGVVFDRSIPAFAKRNFAMAAKQAANRAGYDLGDIDRFVCHPGGAKVVMAIEAALELDPQCLDAERTVLRDFGNMSAPTALFVLKRVIENGNTGKMIMSALGPGFTASFIPLRIGNALA